MTTMGASAGPSGVQTELEGRDEDRVTEYSHSDHRLCLILLRVYRW
jgi:hypothetical protein